MLVMAIAFIASNYSVTQFLDYYGTKTRVEYSGSCLKQDKITYTHGKVVNIKSINVSNYPALENCLFGAVSLTKNADIDSMDLMDMELDLIDMEVFHFLALD